MQRWKYKKGIIFVDLDGTLTNKNNLLSLKVIKKLRNLRRNYIITLTSANSYIVLKTLKRYFEICDYIIAENGGVYETESLKVIADKNVAINALNLLKKNIDGIVEHWSNQFRLSDQVIYRKSDEFVNKIKEFISYNSHLNVRIVDTKYSIQIIQKNINKGLTAKFLINELGLNNIKTYAIGDSEADLELFEVVDYSFAVNNSIEELKKKATYVLSKSYSQGFFEFLNFLK